MADVTFYIKADFDRDDTYEFDLTPYLQAPAGGFNVDRGRGADGNMLASQVSLGLVNRDGTFTPEYTGSPLYGLVVQDTPVRITATFSNTEYVLWTGWLQQQSNTWAIGAAGRAQLTAQSLAGVLRDLRPVNVVLSTTRDTDGAIAAILTAAGLGTTDYDLDDGVQALPYHWVRAQGAVDALREAVQSELGGLLWERADGRLRFESRQARLGTTVDHTWGDGTAVRPYAQAYRVVDEDLVSTVTVSATILTLGQGAQEVFRFSRGKDTRPTADSMALTTGQIYEAEFEYGALLAAITEPVAVVDYLANTAANGTGTDKTAQLTVTVTDLGAAARLRLVNSDAGTIYVTMLRLRGQPVSLTGQLPRFVASKSVPTLHVDRGVELRVPFADDSVSARDYAYATLRTHRYPYPRLELELQWNTDAATVAMLSVELGDLVRYTDRAVDVAQSAYVDDWWYVEAIKHRGLVGKLPTSTVVLVPSYIYRNLDKCEYDLFTRGNLTNDLGTGTSGATWASDAGFNLTSNKARPNSLAEATPNLDLAAADGVVEVTVGLA